MRGYVQVYTGDGKGKTRCNRLLTWTEDAAKTPTLQCLKDRENGQTRI